MRQKAKPPFADGKRSRRNARHTFRKGYDPLQPRGPDGQWTPSGAVATREATDGFIGKVLDGGQRGRLARLGPVRNASDIEERLGISLRGYGRGLNADDVAHTMRRHGNDASPITRSDLANYYGWANTQRIDSAYPASARGKPATLTYAFTAEGHAYRVTETINPRTRLITLKTMRKTRT